MKNRTYLRIIQFLFLAALGACGSTGNPSASNAGGSTPLPPGSGPAPVDNPNTTLTAANKAAAVTFSDTDAVTQEIAGDLLITKATNESNVAAYVLYWGSTGSTKLNPPIREIAKTGSNLVHTFPFGTAVPAGAGYFIVLTKNSAGEMAEGISVKISDRLVLTAGTLAGPATFQGVGYGWDWDMGHPEDSLAAGGATDPSGNFGDGAFYSNVLGETSADRKYTALRIYPPAIFGVNTVALADIQRISFWTKQKAADGIVNSIAPADRTWQLKIYTVNPTQTTWYKTRLNTTLTYYRTNDWMDNSTNANLKFTDSQSIHDKISNIYIPYATLGTGTGTLADMRSALGSETILFIDVIAGSATPSAIIESYLDGLVVELTNGKTAVIDLE